MYHDAKGFLKTVLFLLPLFAPPAFANVDLIFQPTVQAATVGDTVEIRMYAVSDGTETYSVQTIEAILSWDPDRLELLGVDHASAGHAWHLAGFPIDPDDLNAGVGTPWTGVPANDGNAFYVALAAVGDPASVPPSPGLLVTTLRFRAVAATDLTSLSLLPTYGSQSRTRVLAETPPNTDITGDISSTAGVVIGAGDQSRLTLEIEEECATDEIVEVELWMRDLTQSATGFQAFLEYDDGLLQFQSGSSQYTAAPFTGHVTSITAAEVEPGRLNLDGFTYGEGTDEDALLAILRFSVVGECDWTSIDFRDVAGFQSELSYAGTPIPTDLFDSPDFHADISGPAIDLTVSNEEMDETCAATVTFEANVTDNCCLDDGDVVVDVRLLGDNAVMGTPSYAVSDGQVTGGVSLSDLASCPVEVQVTVFAEDCCGNASGSPATAPAAGRWCESFAGGGGGAAGNVLHAWDDASGAQWELSGPTLDHVTLLADTVDGDGNGERVYDTIYLGGELHIDAALWGGSGLQTAAVVQHRHLTHQVFVGGAVDWSASWTDIQTYAVTPHGPGLIVQGTASFVGQGAAPPSGYPPFLGDDGNGGHWGLATDLELKIVGVAIGGAIDATPPSAVCKTPFTVQLDADGHAAIVPADVDDGSWDNCGDVTLVGVAPDTFGCDNVGDVPVTLTVADGCGNEAACNTTVIVEDNVAPVALCRDITVHLNAAGYASITTADIDAGSSDACGIASLSVSPASFTCDDLGANSVTLTVTDVNDNASTCTATVTVADVANPTISCPADIEVAADEGQCYASEVDLGMPTASDNCGAPDVTNDAPAHFPVGVTVVTWTAVDGAGNSTSCEQSVTVTDDAPPTIDCPPDVEIGPDAGLCYATEADLGEPVAADACGVSSVTNDAPEQFPLGSTIVIWTATDDSGNSETCEQTVTVIDDEDPVIECPPDVETGTDPDVCYATNVALGAPGTSDNCGVASVINDAPLQFPVGETLVTWTAIDGASNSASCVQRVRIVENQPPTIECPPDVEVFADAGECSAGNVELGLPNAQDNCGQVTVTNDAPAVFPVGETTVVWTATDAADNTATCEQLVTVIDNQPPTIAGCPEDIYVNADAGGCSAVVSWPEPTAADNCGIESFTTDHAPGEAFIGTTTVTYAAVDVNGNTAVCEFDVIVSDVSEFVVDVQLQGQLYDPDPATPGDVIERCIRFTFYGCEDPVVLEQEMSFNVDRNDPYHGWGSAVFDNLPCGDYACVIAEEPLHSLRTRLMRGTSGLHVNAENQYAAAFTGAKKLYGGDLFNDDPRDRIDIYDYGVFTTLWGWSGDRDAACDTPGPHADINGDGLVTTADFTFIQINFLRHGDLDCCLLETVQEADDAILEISVEELRQAGLENLAVGDLNGDGLLNAEDMAAFMAGARPTPPAGTAEMQADASSPAVER